MAKFKTVYTGGEIDSIKDELDKALDAVYDVKFFELDDEVAFRTNMGGQKQPYIISSIEDKLKNAILVLSDSVEQLKAIRNMDGLSDFVELRCGMIQKKVGDIQEYYKDKTYAEAQHRFKKHTITTSKGKEFEIELEASTREQQISVRSAIQHKTLKILTTIELIMQEQDAKRLKGGMDTPERMTFKTQARL